MCLVLDGSEYIVWSISMVLGESEYIFYTVCEVFAWIWVKVTKTLYEVCALLCLGDTGRRRR